MVGKKRLQLIAAIFSVAIFIGIVIIKHQLEGGRENQAADGQGRFESISMDERLFQIEARVEMALKSGGIHPQAYDEVVKKLDELEAEGASPAKIAAIRALLGQLEVGGVQPKSPETSVSSPTATITQPQVQTKTPAQIQNKKRTQAPVTSASSTPKTQVQLSSCISNPNPVFTHHITDTSRIKYVVPPPTLGYGPSLKPHSYIGTDHARVPVYAPVDIVLDSGAYYTAGPYWLGFTISCEVKMRFMHITEPIQAIKDLFPPAPQEGSYDYPIKGKLSFKAGDLIGYTTPGNWDFGVYNSTKPNRYVGDPTWGNSSVYTTAVCPFDYYSAEMRSAYADKFDSKILEGNPPHGESFCQGAETNP